MKTTLPQTLHDLVNSRAFQQFEESKLGNDLFISDPGRAERMHAASEHGCDGSTHSERIDDQREFLDELRVQALDDCADDPDAETEVEDWYTALSAKLDEVEQWHEKNGSLYEEVG